MRACGVGGAAAAWQPTDAATCWLLHPTSCPAHHAQRGAQGASTTLSNHSSVCKQAVTNAAAADALTHRQGASTTLSRSRLKISPCPSARNSRYSSGDTYRGRRKQNRTREVGNRQTADSRQLRCRQRPGWQRLPLTHPRLACITPDRHQTFLFLTRVWPGSLTGRQGRHSEGKTGSAPKSAPCCPCCPCCERSSRRMPGAASAAAAAAGCGTPGGAEGMPLVSPGMAAGW